MIHDTRVISTDGRPHLASAIHQYLGDAKGHWEGDELVVETTNFTDKTSISENGNGLRHSEALHLVERLTRLDRETLEYRLTIDDPRTYTRPWTMSLFLTSPRGYELLPYDCHEGNHGLPNILSAERAEDSAVEEDAKRRVQRPRRARNSGNGPAVEGSER